MTSPIFALQIDQMASQQYKSMLELTVELKQYLATIAEGEGDVEKLEEMVGHARELYERLVVMRHKAFEDVAEESAPVSKVQPEAVEETPEPPEVEEKPQAAIPFSVDAGAIEDAEPENAEEPATAKPEDSTPETEEETTEEEDEASIPDNQTSLIDAIEEIKGGSLVEKFAAENDEESLVEKLEKAPIGDLVSAISLNQKFQFINELFGGDNERYLAEIESFNSMDSWNSAKKVLAALNDELSWEEGEAQEEFIELIQRRYGAQA